MWALLPGSASAARVVVLGPHGRVVVRSDPFVRGPAVPPGPRVGTGAVRARAARAGVVRAGVVRAGVVRAPRRPAPVTVYSVLARLKKSGALDAADYANDVAAYRGALADEKRLRGVRRTELTSVTETLHQIAAAGQMTASRLPALFTTLAANVQWWTKGPLLAAYQRVELAGSQLVWEYYPGEGIQLSMLANFSKANGLYQSGPSDYPAMQQLLSEVIALGVRRGGGLTWEYYFPFDGGAPPWTSAMSQATALQALAHAYQATLNPYYLQVGVSALPIFTVAPPVGVAEPTAAGVRFLQYTFAPHTYIINAFLQTLIGLNQFAQVSGNAQAAQLFASGNAEAMAEVPGFDTGAWSLYQPGSEDNLSYHELVTGFLGQLCGLTSAPVYCQTEQHFEADLKTPPAVTQLTLKAAAKRSFALRFQLSKISHVGVVVTHGSQTAFSTSASFGYGVRSFSVPALARPGTYGVRLSATDLAGNYAAFDNTLTVAPAPHRGHPRP